MPIEIIDVDLICERTGWNLQDGYDAADVPEPLVGIFQEIFAGPAIPLKRVHLEDSPAEQGNDDGAAARRDGEGTPLVSATPFTWVDPAALPPRRWLYGTRLVRGMLSLIGAAGGVGKSGLAIADALAMVTGRDLLGDKVHDGPKRVWYWNLEDPMDEINRRILAACIHYGITEVDIGGRLFSDSGRDSPLCIAISRRDGAVLQAPIIEALVNELLARQIDVIIVDPFVSCHQVPENDNGAQDMVAKAWAQVAHQAQCAVLLVHHIRKMGGFEATAESLRGGKALVDGARHVRVLNMMTKEEAEKAGLDSHRKYFRSNDDKTNLAPAPEKASWYRVLGVPLANGDNVGVVVPWEWPDAFDGLTTKDLIAVQRHIAGKYFRESAQAKDWIGYEIARVLHLDPAQDKADRQRIKQLLRTWISNGALEIVDHLDDQRRPRRCVVVGQDVCSTSEGGAEQGGAPACSTAPPAPPPLGVAGGGGAERSARGVKLSSAPSALEDLFVETNSELQPTNPGAGRNCPPVAAATEEGRRSSYISAPRPTTHQQPDPQLDQVPSYAHRHLP